MSTSYRLSELLKNYLSPEKTRSLIYDTNSNFNVSYEGYSGFRPGLTERIMNYIDNFILIKYFPEFSLNGRQIFIGTFGTFYNFSSTDMKKGFQELLNQPEFKLYRIKRKNRVLQDDYSPNQSMGIKLQIFFSADKYYEANAIKEETILDKLNQTAFKEYVPNFYLGFTIRIPIQTDKGELIVYCRLSFTEHLIEYTNLLILINKYQYIPTNDDLIKITDIIHTLWKHGVSHNDIAAQNIMFNPIDKNFKLIDFGLATYHNFKFEPGQNIEQLYTHYYQELMKKKPQLSENEGTNVNKLHDLLTYIKQN